jgi:hypothetical protein
MIQKQSLGILKRLWEDSRCSKQALGRLWRGFGEALTFCGRLKSRKCSKQLEEDVASNFQEALGRL